MALLDHIGQEHTCQSCLYWHQHEALPDVGECRRHAPAPSPRPNELFRVFPSTARHDKCGDWEFQP